MSVSSTGPKPTPAHVQSAVVAASQLAGYCPGIRRSPMFPTTADKVAELLKPATDYIREQTGNDVLLPDDTTQEMVSVVSAILLDLELSTHDDKTAKSGGGKI